MGTIFLVILILRLGGNDRTHIFHLSFQMHLFDIDIPGGIRFQESEVLSPGQDFFTFNAGNFKPRVVAYLSVLASY